MEREQYTGIGLIGNENIASIYTVNNGIVDINGTGIYHLFYKEYDHDLLQSAVTMVKIEDTLYYGNKKWKAHTHPEHIRPYQTRVEEHHRYVDTFQLEEHDLIKQDQIYAYGKNRLVFECSISNESNKSQRLTCYGYAAVRNGRQIHSKLSEQGDILIHTGNVHIGMIAQGKMEQYMVEDSPTDFAYQTFLDVMKRKEQKEAVHTDCRLGCVSGEEFTVLPGETVVYRWALIFADSSQELHQDIQEYQMEDAREAAGSFWRSWLTEGIIDTQDRPEEFKDMAYTNLIALKAVCVGGYIPADLTGHYFCNQMPCYYARDSIMVARAFLLAGHVRECESILCYLIERKRKENGEFYQRYDGRGRPNEGANNNVFHQLDSIGYFCRIIYEFYQITGKLLIAEKLLISLIEVLEGAQTKWGMVGAEGGVNEGVFGGAFITSSNMFIYGGIDAAKELFSLYGNEKYEEKCKKLCIRIYAGIQTTFNQEIGRYDYGYVDYHDHIVKKYDTPQYFGPLYGYPNDENMQKTHTYLLKYASFFEDGIGYSEQEYHHGPWLFNTLACAEYCKKYGSLEEYSRKLSWCVLHSNAYGLLPEAVDANQEERCYINPLTWACAEFVSAYFIC
ncbi:hypothetical protein [Faecalicatena contorta]|uniref:Glucoamylase (Glucan-1,4-alpha-glucosidase), GH15 family n=1 Tax=Faecalicatena contorta TaxID=39482 RepID=A0A316A1A2_9FIRM|nr:hypothetical protein [Faecalicatena contorta]PWJ50484.1 GH15 family glucan-1,4-alpha-glucosidase [Faecalicatena contorta]SUQ13892.1 Glucoamylase (glucan-1,4-alpha-glucosidase), GH15 family [Faecalicatena contorta]